MTPQVHHLPEVVRRWHDQAQTVIPRPRTSPLPSLLEAAAKLAEELDFAERESRRKARARSHNTPIRPQGELSLTQELQELCLALSWVRGRRADLSAEGDTEAQLGPLAALEAQLVELLLERLATARSHLAQQATEPTLLDFPPPAPQRSHPT